MSEHKASIAWHSTDQPFTTETYTRQHTWSFDGGVVIPASSAPEYQGDWDRVDPEKGLVASLSSCHMLTFLAVAAKRRIIVTSYEDEAVGTLEKNAEGKIAITRIVLHPKVTFEGEAPSEEDLRKLHDSASRNCFIGNSIQSEVLVEL